MSQTPISESNGDSYHIYATPSPTQVESPHPPAEGQQALTMNHSHHYEFSEGYSPNTNGSHYEMEPVPTSPFPRKHEDPEYAQPTVTIQPYEVPLTVLQSSQDKVRVNCMCQLVCNCLDFIGRLVVVVYSCTMREPSIIISVISVARMPLTYEGENQYILNILIGISKTPLNNGRHLFQSKVLYCFCISEFPLI